jgi:dihydrodipicolinate reductase
MTPGWSSGPPPHERGVSSREQKTGDAADLNYEYCVIRKNYDMGKHEVWFTAHQGQRIVGRSRTAAHRQIFLGGLIRFNRDVEEVYGAFLQTMARNGWEPVGTGQKGYVKTFRKLAAPQ